MSSLGERIRRKRIESGYPLDRIAKDLKIGTRLLGAIEAEEFNKLPGGVFRKSFVLQYAAYLGLDRAAIAAELKHLSAFDDEPVLPQEIAARTAPDVEPISGPRDWSWLTGSLGSFAGVAVVVTACAGLWLLWEKYSTPSTQPDAVASVTQSSPPPRPADPPAATVTTAATGSEPGSGAPVAVEITASEETWIQVVSDGKRVYSDAIPAHGTKKIGATERVRILIGNAGGLEISLNGKPIGPIGPRGHVRTVELTQAGFQIVQPAPKPPASSPL